MAKLYFRYGAVGSAKTLNLLAVAHAYEQQNKRALLVKPALDDRFGKAHVKSRAGLERQADLVLRGETVLEAQHFDGVHCVLVDEAQFLTPAQIDQLRGVATGLGIPVICYGLRTDFRTNLFPGALRLMEVADAIEEIKTTCAHCNSKAVFNLKFSDGIPTRTGPTVDLGCEEKYIPTCSRCYQRIHDLAPAIGDSEPVVRH